MPTAKDIKEERELLAKLGLEPGVGGQRLEGLNMVFPSFDEPRRKLAATGLVWKDDSQVWEIMAKRIVTDDDPYTDVVFYKVPGEAKKTLVCLNCQQRFVVSHSKSDRKYCSRPCSYAHHRKRIEVPCARLP